VGKPNSANATKELLAAITARNRRGLETALAAGADLRSAKGAEAFVTAASYGDAAAVSRLLAAGADPNKKFGPWFALYSGANYPEVVEVLLAGGADVKLAGRTAGAEGTALHGAWCAPRSIKLLIAAGANPNARDHLGRTPLHVVAQSGGVAEVQALLAGGADVHVRDKKRKTPLDVAIKRAHSGVIAALRKARSARRT
jgi:ankyrin repeat protein